MKAIGKHVEAPAEAKEIFGFWIYLMTDCLIFASLFANYAVASTRYAGGPTGKDVFDLTNVAVETGLLLASSFTIGMALLAIRSDRPRRVLIWLATTFALGSAFVAMEIADFQQLVTSGAGPDRSAFLSAYFGVVGAHGLHVFAGLVWMALLSTQIWWIGDDITARLESRLIRLGMFWHFLDIIWVLVFTFVYLIGVM